MKNLLHITERDGLCNCRIKLYPTDTGEWMPVEKMVSDKKIFNPSGLEKEGWKTYEKNDCDEGIQATDKFESAPENVLRACRRARSKLHDIIRCNLDFKYFCTLTFDSSVVDRTDYKSVLSKFTQWTDNRVRRNGLKYVGVVEFHKDRKGMHFHVLCNDKLRLVDSGTVSVPDRKKPIKTATADRYKIADKDRKIVYNISDWGFGFSTAIEITGDPGRVKVARYLQKYLAKQTERPGGRWYYSGGDLLRPQYKYCIDDFYETEETYTIKVPGNTIKVLCL